MAHPPCPVQLAPTELLHLVSAIRSRLAHFALPDACSLLLSAARLSLLVRPRTPLAEDLLRVVLALPYTGPISVLSAKGLLAMHAAEGPAPSARQRATPSSTKQQQGQEQQQDIALSDAGKQATAGKASIALRRDYTAVAQLLTGLRTALFSAGQLHSSLLLQEHCMQAYQRLLPLVLRELHGHWSQLDAETLTALICAYRLRGGAGVSEDALRTSQVLSR